MSCLYAISYVILIHVQYNINTKLSITIQSRCFRTMRLHCRTDIGTLRPISGFTANKEKYETVKYCTEIMTANNTSGRS